MGRQDALLLKTLAELGVLPAQPIQMTARIRAPVRSGGEVLGPEIHAEPVVRLDGRRLGGLGDGPVERPIPVDPLGLLANPMIQPGPVVAVQAHRVDQAVG